MNIVFLDCTQNYGYNYSASNTKVDFLIRGLNQKDNKCTVINGVIGYGKLKSPEYKNIENIGEVITYSGAKLLSLNLIKNFKTIIKDLDRLKEGFDKNILILSAPHLHIYYLYVLIGRGLGYKVVTISHEWLTTIKNRYLIQKFESYLYTKTFGYGIDAILPISHYISNRIKRFKKPELLTPILADFELENQIINRNQYFTYCVYAAYYRVITMIIDSYVIYSTYKTDPYDLILILSGREDQIKYVKNYIEKVGCLDRIHIKRGITYDELFYIYRTSIALLIPLDPDCAQDHARFSQKIAEYLSSSTPIISNSVGEIPYYFKDKENIILCDYKPDAFADAMCWVSNNRELANRIGSSGFHLGKTEFNYQSFGIKLNRFLADLFK